VQAVDSCWAALVAVLGEEATNGNPTATGLSTRIERFSFICITQILVDVLPVLSKLSKVSQADTLDFHVFHTQLTVTKEMLNGMFNENSMMTAYGNIMQQASEDENGEVKIRGMKVSMNNFNSKNVKDSFLKELISQLERRFGDDEVTLLSALNKILNLTQFKSVIHQELTDYGVEELQVILDQFKKTPNEVQETRAKEDFMQFKIFARRSEAQNLETFGQDLILNFKEIYPDFAIFMAYFLCVPLNSAPCERGFSAQNQIKSKFRSRLGEERLEEIMRVSMSNIDMNYHLAAEKFTEMKIRRK
jgi:hypothetical protein